jgi:anhydro-N-acetylmuramic acid kinase
MLYDDEGGVASAGTVNQELLKTLKTHPFFLQSLPKTTGQELFNMKFFQDAQRNSNTLDLHTADLVATLTRFTAETIAEAIQEYVPNWQDCTIYLSGGGAKNLTLENHIKELLAPCKFNELRTLGFPPHAKEATLFALLAHQTLTGTVLHLGNNPEHIPAVSLGKISLPD